MKPSLPLTDAEQRQQALDPQQSFIVQAPAGSGKTELLVRRYLVLLTRVPVPEAIIAITFTRKAANEMRIRIMQALELAQKNTVATGKETERYRLAKKVLAHEEALSWNLLSNPNRLRILTIDSFCQSLTRQMPLLSGLGEKLIPVDHPDYLYRLAVQELLNQLEDKSLWQAPLSHLLRHLDNDFQRVENLFVPMLARREQWLDYLQHHHDHLREHLEQTLFHINQTYVEKLNTLIPKNLADELLQLVNFSLQQRQITPLTHPNDRNFWQIVSQLLLTENHTWRKQWRKNEGFPAAKELKNKSTQIEVKNHKKQLLNLISQLSQQNSVKETLIALKQAPPLHYTDAEWQILKSLFELLPVLVAHLKIIFQQQQKVDYTEILLAASAALGSAEDPTDLALALDYQIQHLLVDEFQDTSRTQWLLIEKLTAGWQNQEGRSLFLVGDPMQSIYRFRKAEVSLFSYVQHNGLGSLQLQPIQLSVNFRSTPGIIEWVNQQFSQLIATQGAIAQETVTYAPAYAHLQTTHQGDVVHSYWQQAEDLESSETTEAEQIINIIQTIQQQDPQASIAILVRARRHLRSVLPALCHANIPYQAIEIDSLAEKSAVQDLLSLTRALHHLGDRIAWLALLRSPYCGLSLNDLYCITQFSDPKQTTFWQQLQHFEEIPLPLSTKQRLRSIVPILQQSLQQQGRLPFPLWVKQTWLALGGPATLSNWQEMDPIQTYLNFLENKIMQTGETLDVLKLGDELNHIYTQTTSAPSTQVVEVMTIHKAKGLEFDHVILPGLHRRGRPEQSPLLLYSEKISTSQRNNLLLAPIKSSQHEEHDRIYHYLLNEEKQKNAAELIRLLYVACTRAKKSLHLLGSFMRVENALLKEPAPHSLLSYLYPVLNIQTENVLALTPHKNPPLVDTAPLLKRLIMPISTSTNTAQINPSPVTNAQAYAYQWQLHPERIVGTVIHRLLYQISQDGLDHWDSKKIMNAQTMFACLLAQKGVLASQIPQALARLNTCLEKTLADPRGRWILNPHHASQSEYAITALFNGKPKNCVIDRTFIELIPESDSQQSDFWQVPRREDCELSGNNKNLSAQRKRIRWIIDYKTTDYQGDQPEEFLKLAQQQHQQQLNNYAHALSLDAEYCGSQTIRCGLYFPLISLWCEWEFAESPIDRIVC